MGRVMFGGGKVGMEEPSNIKPNFADNAWSTIIKACQKNKVPDTWVVGSQKAMTINGTSYTIDIIGKNHDTYTAGGTAPLTFQMHNVYGTTYQMNSTATTVGGWTDCAMRNTHLPTIFALMPSEVQSGIKEVNKLTSAGNGSSTITTTADKLFLLSEVEVFNTTTNSKSGEGKQYAYYAAGNSPIKNSTMWWGRSPHPNSMASFFRVRSDGTSNGSSATALQGVAFAFCF